MTGINKEVIYRNVLINTNKAFLRFGETDLKREKKLFCFFLVCFKFNYRF